MITQTNSAISDHKNTSHTNTFQLLIWLVIDMLCANLSLNIRPR